jgi:hypothetical protein
MLARSIQSGSLSDGSFDVIGVLLLRQAESIKRDSVGVRTAYPSAGRREEGARGKVTLIASSQQLNARAQADFLRWMAAMFEYTRLSSASTYSIRQAMKGVNSSRLGG